MPEQHQGTRSTSDDQWTVVPKHELAREESEHSWRMVRLRNGAGKVSAGLQCLHCGQVERVTDFQMRRFGQQQRIGER